jgi:hypothetical protein
LRWFRGEPIDSAATSCGWAIRANNLKISSGDGRSGSGKWYIVCSQGTLTISTDNYQNPKPGKTYISPSLAAFGDNSRRVRIATKAIESPTAYAFGTIKSEQVIRQKAGAKSNITAKFFEDDRGLFVLSIQGYSIATDKPHNASFSFVGDEINTLLEFIANVRSISFKGGHAVNIDDEELRRLVLSKHQAHNLVADNEALFAEIVASAVTHKDIVAVAYRKKQLEVFRQLLEDGAYFARAKAAKKCTDEALWQKFFEKNPWIFGYGLNFVYLETLNEQKLEQVVQGYRIGSHGKRVDALMKTRGVISSLCFVEIKTHETPLLGADYRSGCWAPSSEVAGAVAQVQGTVAAAIESIRSKLTLNDSDGFPTGEEAFNYSPRSYLVLGTLRSLVGEHGVNQEKFRSFELFRRNVLAPEIITFDELYERASFIAHRDDS